MTIRLKGERLALRSPVESDRADLEAVFSSPEVVRWWGPSRGASPAFEAPDGCRAFVVEDGDRVVGLVHLCEEPDPQYRHASLDMALHPDVHGRGYAPEVIGLLVRYAFDKLGHHRISIDPNLANHAAIRAYEKVGFKPVGVMRRYEWDSILHRWTDGLLMDLIKEDFGEPIDDDE